MDLRRNPLPFPPAILGPSNLTEADRQNWEISASRWPLRAGLAPLGRLRQRPSPENLKALYQARRSQPSLILKPKHHRESNYDE
ncbi:hypothetical protein [Halomicronema hongdechloris]|uniref:hypothetical protein n=1 Tax=Halomicronema hongdechloris TaxID=1209493 RepID=UPI0010CC1B30|nr:hypothetical protein [Halomicronema hongdechloris]